MVKRPYQIMGVSNLSMTKIRMKMWKEETIRFQPKVWIPCLNMNIFTTHNCSMLLSSEEIWPKHKLVDLENQKVHGDLLAPWVSPMLGRQCQKILIQLNIGNRLIKMSWTLQPAKIRLNQEDHFGQSIDKPILLKEDNTKLNSLIHLETMATIQEIFCLPKQQDKETETSSFLSEPLRSQAIYQATMVSYPTLILIKTQWSNPKAKTLEIPLSSKILLKIKVSKFLDIKDTRLWALLMTEEL